MKQISRPHQTNFNLRQPEGRAMSFLLLGLLGLPLFYTPLHADDSFDDTDYVAMMDEKDKGIGWNISPGFNGGYTDVGTGYQGYENLGNGGIDIYFRPPIPQFPNKWDDRMVFRLSFDYFPLQVPDDVYYTTEDLYTLSGTVLYRLTSFSGTPEHKRFVPFLGAGPALEWDHVSVKSPALNEEGKYLHLGLTASAGIMLPTIAGVRLIPEVRYFTMKEPDKLWTSHVSYNLGLSYWIPANQEE